MGMGIDFCTPTKPIPQPWVWWVGGGYGGFLVVGMVIGMVGWWWVFGGGYGGLVMGFWL